MGKLLGHYTNISSLESILEKRELKFGSFDRTNDPFENRNLEFTVGIDSDVEADSSLFFNDGQLRKPFRLLCFSHSSTIDYFYKRPRMWSQYANDHHGCCLIFDKDKFDEKFTSLKIENSKKSQSRVFYNLDEKESEILDFCVRLKSLVPDYQNIEDKKITDFLYSKRKLFLYSKMLDWKEEKEYRYCIYTNVNKNIFIDVSNSLSEIIIGEKVSILYQRMLYTWGKEKGISISHIYWENGFPIKNKLTDDFFQTLDDIEKYKSEFWGPMAR